MKAVVVGCYYDTANPRRDFPRLLDLYVAGRLKLDELISREYTLDESYGDRRCPLGWLASGDPLHVVCSKGDVEPALRIVTVYEPEDALWESDYKTRKR